MSGIYQPNLGTLEQQAKIPSALRAEAIKYLSSHPGHGVVFMNSNEGWTYGGGVNEWEATNHAYTKLGFPELCKTD